MYKIVFPIFFLGSVLLFWLAGGIGKRVDQSAETSLAHGQEIDTIIASHNLQDQQHEYLQLIERVGAEEAQEMLKQSGLPFTGQTHLLNHTIGEWLFERFGVQGIVQCKEYFLASCYHGLIISAMESYGSDKAAAQTLSGCQDEPPGVFAQCVHALGHGLLAWHGYSELLTALRECDTLLRDDYTTFAFHCYDGVFMENIWGIHEGSPSSKRWIKAEDPFYPCSDPHIEDRYLAGCWSNQPALMYQLFDGDIQKVGTECSKVPSEPYQRICFDGLARQIHPLTNGSAQYARDLCSLLGTSEINPCLISIAQAGFSVGDRVMPFEICNEMASERCYSILVGMIRGESTGVDRRSLCEKINNEVWRKQCLQNGDASTE
jgi:hypothetical protein